MKRRRPKKLVSERVRLRAEIERLQGKISELENDVSLRLEIRGIHTDVDSIKHMVRGIQHKMGAGAGPSLGEYIDPNIGKILQEVRGGFASASQPLKTKTRRKKRAKRR